MDNKSKKQAQLEAELATLRHQLAQLTELTATQAQQILTFQAQEEQHQELAKELRRYENQVQILAAERTTEWVAANEKILQEIIEREWVEEELRKVTKRYELATKAGKVGVWDWDLWSGEFFIDPILYTILGLKEQAVDSLEEWISYIHPADAERVRHTVEAHVAAGSTNFELEHRIHHQDGSIRWFLVRGSTIFDGDKKPYRLIGTNTDITDYKRAEEKLREYTLKLKARNEELDAYAHTVAHDLKNPLSAMTGIAEVLAVDYKEHEQLNHYLQVIARSGRKANNIIHELLLLASVRQQQEIKLGNLDMAKIVAEVKERLLYLIDEYQAELVLPSAWPTAVGYGPWIEEVWANYISNAIKYGGSPPRLELGATAQANGKIRFWVRDNGPGLSEAEQSQIFAPFAELKKNSTKGHGLGLSIVQRIVKRLGGEVGVEGHQPPESGCTFYFVLPSEPPPSKNDG